MIEDLYKECIYLKNKIIGCDIKRKYRNRKYKKYHIKGITDILIDNPILITPGCLLGMRLLRRIINRNEEE